MADFFFDIQRFATVADGQVTLSANETYTLDGVDFTAGANGAVLKADTATEDQITYTVNNITGITSGEVTASLTSGSSAEVTFNGATAFDFTCTDESDALKVSYGKSSLGYTSGKLTYSATGLTMPEGSIGLTGSIAIPLLKYSVDLTVPSGGSTLTFNDTTATFHTTDELTANLSFDESTANIIKNLTVDAIKNLGAFVPAVAGIINGKTDEEIQKVIDIASKIVSENATIGLTGDVSFDTNKLTLSMTEDSTVSVDVLDYEIEFAANGGTVDSVSFFLDTTSGISAGAKITPSTDTNASLIAAFSAKGTTIFDGTIKVDSGTVTADIVNGLVNIDAGTAVTLNNGDNKYSATITYPEAATIGFTVNEDGDSVISADGLKLNIDVKKDGQTVFNGLGIEFDGEILLNPDENTFGLSKDTKTTLTYGKYSAVLEVTDDASINFALDDDKFVITAPEGDGDIKFALLMDGNEVNNGSVNFVGTMEFDIANRTISTTKGTAATFTVGEYAYSMTASDDAGFTFEIGDGKFSVTPGDGDGKIDILLTKGDNILFGGNLEVSGGFIAFDVKNQQLMIDKGVTTKLTFGDYSYSVTAASNEGVVLNFAADDGKITVSSADGETNALELELSNGDKTLTADVEFNGSVTVDATNQKISWDKDTTTTISVGDYVASITTTDEAGFSVAHSDGKLTFTNEDGDGKLKLNLTKGNEAIFNSEVEFVGSFSLDVTEQKVSVADDSKISFTINGVTTTVSATDDAGFTVAEEDGKIVFTPGDGDGKLNITRQRGDTELIDLDLEVKGSIFIDTAANAIGMTDGSSVSVTVGEYTVTLTDNEDAGVSIGYEDGAIVLKPQDGEDSVDIEVTKGDEVLFKNTLGISDGSVKVDVDDQKVSVTEGTTVSLLQGENDESTVTFTAKKDTDISIDPVMSSDGMRTLYFTFEGDGASVDMTAERDGKIVFNGTASIGGTISYRASTNTFAMIGSDSTYADKDASIALEVGNYSFTAKTDGQTVINAFTIDKDGKMTVTFPESEYSGLNIIATKSGNELFNGYVNVDGSVTYDSATNEFIVPADTTMNITVGEYSALLSVDDQAGFVIGNDSGKVTITPGNNDGRLSAIVYKGDTVAFAGELEVTDGSIVFDNNNRTLSVTKGTTTTVTLGEHSVALTANEDAGINLGLDDNGKLVITPQEGDGSIDVVYSRNGQAAFANNVEISGGSIVVDALSNGIGLTKGTMITLTQADEVQISVTALDDASATLTAVEGGIRFAPDSDDGDLQLSVTRDGVTRIATIGIDGAVVYTRGGNIALEDGTTVDIDWINSEGVNTYNLKLTSNGSSGFISLDSDKGLGITSNDGKLDMTLTLVEETSNPMEFKGVTGTIWYNSGKALLVEGTSLKSTGTFRRSDVELEVAAVGGDAYAEFYTNYTIYGADTGAFKLTMTYPDGNEGIISVNEGALSIGRDGNIINEGSDISFSSSVDDESLTFTTSEAGNYTLNGHELVTTTEGVQLTANKDNFILSANDSVTCDGITFAGGDVTLAADGAHVIGAGISATGFGTDKTFVLTEAGNVTVDGRVFELIEDVPTGITVTGIDDGYIFGHTKENGSIFTEKFAVDGDSSYSLQLQHNGLIEVNGISADTTITGGAIIGGSVTHQNFDIVTEEEGTFTFGAKAYEIGGDSIVTINAAFESSDADDAHARAFSGLSGTVSGDMSGDAVTINGADGFIRVYNDDDFKIVADENGTELYDISDGSTVEALGGVSKIHTDTTGEFTFGVTEEDSLKVTVTSDSDVVFDFDEDEYLVGIESVDGGLMFSEEAGRLEINGIDVTVDSEFSSINAYTNDGGSLFFHDVQDDSFIETDEPEKVWVQMVGASMTLNNNELELNGDKNGIWMRDGGNKVVDLDEGASLTVSEAGDYTVNNTELTADSGDTFVGLDNATDAYIYDADNPLITRNTSTDDIVDAFTHGFDYGTPITDQDEVKELLEEGDRDQILAMRFEDTVSADFSGDNAYKNVTLAGEYAQSLKFNNDGYNVAVVDEDARGKKDITAGNGGDLIVIDYTKAQVSVTAGEGNDTLVSKGDNVFVSLTGGKTDMFALDGNMTLDGYDASTGSGFGTTKKDIVAAVEDGSIDFADGKLSIDSAKVTFDNNSEVIALYDREGNKNLVGFASQDDLLDTSDATEDMLLVGKGNSTMLGGMANDTVLMSAGDVVNAGEGRNYIKLVDPDERNPLDAGSDIILDSGDRDTVENFSAGFGNKSDRIYFDPDTATEFKFDGTNLSVTSDGNLRGILTDVGDDADFVEFLTADSDGDDVKVAVAKKNATIVVGDELADLYYGEESGIDFTAYTHPLMLDMDGDDGIVLYGINNVIAGSGLTTIVGTDGKDTLTAGSGGTRMWSNWGNDLMIGNTSDDKNKETEFFYLAGDGHDTIRNFEFFTPDNALTADKLNLGDNAVTDAKINENGDVYLKLEDDDDWLAIEGAQGKKLRVNDFIAKVDDKVVIYEDDVDFYVATGEVAVMQVNESAEVWLDDTEDKFYAGDFRIIDASRSTGPNTLAGNTDDNTIIGGSGSNSLWGGDGAEGDDVLYGGEGNNAFFYTFGNGSDTILGVNDGDAIVLHGITLDQIASADITADAVEINFTDGGSVRVEGTADVTYHLGDGSRYSADHEQGEWNSK